MFKYIQMKYYYGLRADAYSERDLVMFDSMKKTGSSHLDHQAWFEHSQKFKPCLQEISKVDPDILEIKKLIRRLGDDTSKIAEKHCCNIEPGFKDSSLYDGFLSVVKKWKKQSNFTPRDLEKNITVVKEKVNDLLFNKAVVEDNVAGTLENLENAIRVYSRDLSNLDLYALEHFLDKYVYYVPASFSCYCRDWVVLRSAQSAW